MTPVTAMLSYTSLIYMGVEESKARQVMKMLEDPNPAGEHIGINCWHISDVESLALWQQYASQYGVAIKSSIIRLKSSVDGEEKPVYMGKIKYIDYAVDIQKVGNIFNRFLNKRVEFEYEKELRLMIMYPKNRPIKYIRVNLNSLIDQIVVSPYAPEWHTQFIEGTIKRFGLHKEVVKSQLMDQPDKVFV